MKKLIVLLIAVVLCLAAMGQETVVSEKRLTAIGVIFSPAVAFRQLNYTPGNQWVQDVRDNEEVPKFGFSGGCIVHFRLKKQIPA